MNTLITLSIAVLIPIFAIKSYDLLTMTDDNKSKSGGHTFDEKYRATKSMTMIGISCVTIITGTVIKSLMGDRSMSGISLGGFFLLIHTVLNNWLFYNLKEQVVIIGLSLFSLLIFSSTGLLTKTGLSAFIY